MTPEPRQEDDAWLRAMVTALRRVAACNAPGPAAVLLRELLLDHVGERARCLFYDREADAVWSAEDGAPDLPYQDGLVGAVARSGEVTCLDDAARHPRFRAELDDPDGTPHPRLLLQPVIGHEGLHAVLVVARSAASSTFDAAARARVADLARRVSVHFDQLSLEAQLETTAHVAPAASGPLLPLDTFRAQAVDAYSRRPEHGQVVRVASSWTTWTYRLLLLSAVVAALYLCLVDVGHYATGVAVVRLGGRTEVTAVSDAHVAELLVTTGDAVEEGTPLVRLHDAEDAAELRRLEVELDVEMRNLLRDPADQEARRSVARLRGERERAILRGREHVLRATREGVVRDIRARPGQAVDAGDVLLSITREHDDPQLYALLPGDERPRLRPGMLLRVELDGYRDARQTLVVDRVHEDVVSPAEAIRLLGSAVGDGMELSGPVVMVMARLPADGFVSRGVRYRHHDGMRGDAEVLVRTTSIIEALIPALERLR